MSESPSRATAGTSPPAARAKLTAVVAMTPEGVIGNEGDMPWRLSSDLKRFKRLTLGGTLIMGRRTYDSIGRPLPGRETIVITRNSAWSAPGVRRAGSPDEAVDASAEGAAYVVGGAEIYRQLLPRCEQVWLTRVWSNITGDTTLSLDLSGYRVIEQSRYPAGVRDEVPTEFVKMIRRNS